MNQNLQILADANRALTVRYIVESSVDHGKQYGAIQNMWAQVWCSSSGEKKAKLPELKHVRRGQANPVLLTSSSTKPEKDPRINSH